MNIAILLLIIKLTYAGTNELCMAMSSRCQLSAERVNRFLHLVSEFTQKLELAFHQASNTSAQYKDVLRELDAPYVWLLLTSIAPTLLENLKAVRDEVTRLENELTFEKTCLEYFNLFLGDEESYFSGSYLELLIKSLSATKYTKLAELSTKQALFVRLELRRMHIERECFLSRNEEMHELYCCYLVVFMSLINYAVGQVISMYAQQHTLSLTIIPLKAVGPVPNCSDITLGFFRKYVDPGKDFFVLNEQVHLRKSSNFKLAYRNWLALLELIPNVTIRREYFNERKDLLFNFRRIESRVNRMYMDRNNFAKIMKWKSNDMLNLLTLAFDLVSSLISFRQEKIPVTKVRRMLLEVIECMKCIAVYDEHDRII